MAVERVAEDHTPVSHNVLIEEDPVVAAATSFRVIEYRGYTSRWYILAVFALVSLHQCLAWNTFGPIALEAQYAYGWSDGTLAMIANWGSVMLVVAVAPCVWLLEERGLREATVAAAAMGAVGAVMRTLTINTTMFTFSSHVCGILIGVAGGIIGAGPTAISAAWFPPSERTTATAINQAFSQLGNGVSFLLGPYMVPDIFVNHSSVLESDALADPGAPVPHDVRITIQWYMVVQAGAAVFLLICVVAYFPSRPPTPPSASSALPRTDFRKGVITLLRNKNAWLTSLGYAIPFGIVGSWPAIMTLCFKSLGIGDSESGRIGAISVVISCIASLITGAVTDLIGRRIKVSLVLLMLATAACFTWLTCISEGFIAFSRIQLYVSTIAGNAFCFACSPLFFEFVVEMSYPVSEGVVGGFLTCLSNTVGFVFYCVFFIKDITYGWVNYVIVCSALVSVPLVLSANATYARSALDNRGEASQYHVLREDPEDEDDDEDDDDREDEDHEDEDHEDEDLEDDLPTAVLS